MPPRKWKFSDLFIIVGVFVGLCGVVQGVAIAVMPISFGIEPDDAILTAAAFAVAGLLAGGTLVAAGERKIQKNHRNENGA